MDAKELIESLEDSKLCDDFKNYVRDIYMSYKAGTIESGRCIANRVALFSVNEGNGLEEMIDIVNKLWCELEDYSSLGTEYETLFYPVMDDDMNYKKYVTKRDIAIHDIEEILASYYTRVLCIDISEWMEMIEGPEFRAVLYRIRRKLPVQYIYLRIPAVDELSLRKIREAINWFINVDVIYTPPFSLEDYYDHAFKKAKENDIILDDESKGLLKRVIDDRRKDRFFKGIKTVDAIVDDMMFNAMRRLHHENLQEV